MGHFAPMKHFLQPRHFSMSYTGRRWASIPKSFSEGFMQLFGLPNYVWASKNGSKE